MWFPRSCSVTWAGRSWSSQQRGPSTFLALNFCRKMGGPLRRRQNKRLRPSQLDQLMNIHCMRIRLLRHRARSPFRHRRARRRTSSLLQRRARRTSSRSLTQLQSTTRTSLNLKQPQSSSSLHFSRCHTTMRSSDYASLAPNIAQPQCEGRCRGLLQLSARSVFQRDRARDLCLRAQTAYSVATR